jgi:hypothetical protein
MWGTVVKWGMNLVYTGNNREASVSLTVSRVTSAIVVINVSNTFTQREQTTHVSRQLTQRERYTHGRG